MRRLLPCSHCGVDLYTGDDRWYCVNCLPRRTKTGPEVLEEILAGQHGDSKYMTKKKTTKKKTTTKRQTSEQKQADYQQRLREGIEERRAKRGQAVVDIAVSLYNYSQNNDALTNIMREVFEELDVRNVVVLRLHEYEKLKARIKELEQEVSRRPAESRGHPMAGFPFQLWGSR